MKRLADALNVDDTLVDFFIFPGRLAFPVLAVAYELAFHLFNLNLKVHDVRVDWVAQAASEIVRGIKASNYFGANSVNHVLDLSTFKKDDAMELI